MDEQTTRRDLIRICHLMYERSYVVSSDGNVSVRLDDGRILQNRSTLHQTLKTSLKPPPQNSSARSEPLTLEIDSDTTLELDGSGK